MNQPIAETAEGAARWGSRLGGLVWRTLVRAWGRDVMLYVGGVSFFAMLAVFPALEILLGVYSILLTPEQALVQASAFAGILPPAALTLFQSELLRLSHAPVRDISLQSLFALVVGIYAAHRGFKALFAGLSFIHDEEAPRGFLSFNLLAAFALVGAFLLLTLVSGLFLALRFARSELTVPLHLGFFLNEWTWTSVGLSIGLTLVYRYAMSSTPVPWRLSAVGGVAAAALSLAASWASSVYATQIANYGATYGSIAAVIVMLVWLSWTVNAIFLGAALTTEIELLVDPTSGRAHLNHLARPKRPS
ncbi:MAG TPA: YihY/virulence factor BrkB family protein [Caulobacteraceae bacterium]|nr:YihY/virulence factor BrkB family protein [Caulobacteraceae bacterium]